METKIYDKETGSTIYMEGTFANLTARIEDEDGDTVFEFKNGHLSEFNQIVQSLGNMNNEPEEHEDNREDEEDEGNNEPYKIGDKFVVVNGNSFFDKGEKVVLNSIASDGVHLYKKSDGQEWYAASNRLERIEEDEDSNKESVIEKGTLCVVNTDNPDYCLSYDKGTVIEFIDFEGDELPYYFTDSNGYPQYMERKDFDILEEQVGTKRRFKFAESSKILLTKDTDFTDTKVKLIGESTLIKDDGHLVIDSDDEDGIPLIKSEKDGTNAFEYIEKFTKRESIEVGDTVKVGEGKEHLGAKGIAVVSDIVGTNVYLKGYDSLGEYSETWINNIKNVTKEF